MKKLAIKDVAEATGVAAGTIRMWEQRYGFPEPERTPAGYRLYSDDDVETLRRVIEADFAKLPEFLKKTLSSHGQREEVPPQLRRDAPPSHDEGARDGGPAAQAQQQSDAQQMRLL